MNTDRKIKKDCFKKWKKFANLKIIEDNVQIIKKNKDLVLDQNPLKELKNSLNNILKSNFILQNNKAKFSIDDQKIIYIHHLANAIEEQLLILNSDIKKMAVDFYVEQL